MASPAAAEAAALSEALPGLLLEARRLSAAAPGAHGRRRAGPGEAFWQFRDHRPEDGARLVDWRRSGRGDRLYVREREREAAQTALFWLDGDAGFDWSSAPSWPTKRRRALVLCVALAMTLSRGGERVGRLGGNAARGAGAGLRLAYDLAPARAGAAPPPPPGRPAVIYASDFYTPAGTWRERLKAAAAAGARGALLMVADPAEEDFPFAGRTEFERPGARERVLLGRPERAAAAYAARLAEHRAALREAAAALGFALVAHRTDRAPAPALAQLALLLGER